jgi:sec-independent protein translocase protein TatB
VLGISGPEFLVLLAVAAIVLGPERLPQYAQQLARLVRELRRMAQGASEQVRAELGPEFDDIDWRKLDPRQYDPRRIVREALADSFDDPLGLDTQDPLGLRKPTANGSGPPANRARGRVTSGEDEASPASGPRFDPDAT